MADMDVTYPLWERVECRMSSQRERLTEPGPEHGVMVFHGNPIPVIMVQVVVAAETVDNMQQLQ